VATELSGLVSQTRTGLRKDCRHRERIRMAVAGWESTGVSNGSKHQAWNTSQFPNTYSFRAKSLTVFYRTHRYVLGLVDLPRWILKSVAPVC
jgi:hypothetical protein